MTSTAGTTRNGTGGEGIKPVVRLIALGLIQAHLLFVMQALVVVLQPLYALLLTLIDSGSLAFVHALHPSRQEIADSCVCF